MLAKLSAGRPVETVRRDTPRPLSGAAAGKLLDGEDDELCWPERCEADHDIDHPAIDIGWRGRRRIASNGITRFGCRAGERTLHEQTLHEGTDAEPELRPERRAVRFEHGPLGTARYALLHERRQAPHWYELPVRAPGIVTIECPRAEQDRAETCEAANAIDGTGIESLQRI